MADWCYKDHDHVSWSSTCEECGYNAMQDGCEHVYKFTNGHFECTECGHEVEYDIMVRDVKEIE